MKKNRYSVIPACVLYDGRLTAVQKVLMAVISNMSCNDGRCDASYRTLAEATGCSEDTVKKHITTLVEYGYLSLEDKHLMIVDRGQMIEPVASVKSIKEPKSVTEPLKEPKSDTKLFTQCKDSFLEAFKRKKAKGYYFTAKDGFHLKQLIDKIRHGIRESMDVIPSDDVVYKEFERFISMPMPAWIDETFTLPILNSRYNEIISSKSEMYGRVDKHKIEEFIGRGDTGSVQV